MANRCVQGEGGGGLTVRMLLGARQTPVQAWIATVECADVVTWTGRPVLTAEERVRLDENDDAVWYAQPRIGAIHTDGHFKQALRGVQ